MEGRRGSFEILNRQVINRKNDKSFLNRYPLGKLVTPSNSHHQDDITFLGTRGDRVPLTPPRLQHPGWEGQLQLAFQLVSFPKAHLTQSFFVDFQQILFAGDFFFRLLFTFGEGYAILTRKPLRKQDRGEPSSWEIGMVQMQEEDRHCFWVAFHTIMAI